MEDKEEIYRIWNYMEQTHDCLRCGARWDFQNNCVGRDIETVTHLCDLFSERHSECEPSRKGDSLRAYNDWYFENSQIIFDANLDQLYKLIKTKHTDMTYEAFLKDHDSSNYISFRKYYPGSSIEVHRLWPTWRYYMFKEMWKPSRERKDLIKALKSVGAKIVSREKSIPMPRSRYNWDSPGFEMREPERVWR